MSQLYVDNIKSRVGGAVSFSQGIVAAGGTISGNLSIGGTLTYEDVTNVSVTGIITANNGISVPNGEIVVGTALTINQTGIDAVGVITASSFAGDGSNLSNLDIPAGFNELDAALFN